MLINRIWAMPNLWTFGIPPIKKLLAKHMTAGVWYDPFCGKNNQKLLFVDLVTNDINPGKPADFHMDALDFLKSRSPNVADGVVYDPPYSITQAREYGIANNCTQDSSGNWVGGGYSNALYGTLPGFEAFVTL